MSHQAASTDAQDHETLHLVSVNVRMDPRSGDPPVPIPENGSVPPAQDRRSDDVDSERPWAERRSRMVDAVLAGGDVDFMGFQEVLHNQLLDIQTLLGPQYSHVGVGRNDGKEAGEYSPIFWDNSKFELVRNQTVWLSETPEKPSKGWDADQTRIANIATFSFLSGSQIGRLIHVVNTHYDHMGVRARAESSLLIREKIAAWVSRFDDRNTPHASEAPVILMGDFNSPPNEEGYHNITSAKPLPNGLPSVTFLDSYHHLRTRSPSNPSGQSGPYGPQHTYSDFPKGGSVQRGSRIDFIMLASEKPPAHDLTLLAPERARGGWNIMRYGVFDNWVEDGDCQGWIGRWSDHRGVRVIIRKE